MKSWIQSLEGRKLEPLALRPEMVGTLKEIAHSLAGEFRFTRQTELRYSVAEHCVRGSRLLPAAFAGAFLLHELSEVYLPDIAGPVKPSLFVEMRERRKAFIDGVTATRSDEMLIISVRPGETPEDAARAFLGLASWVELEHQHTRTILEALGLSSLEPLIYSPEVKRMDLAMLAAEKRDLCGEEPEPWGLPYPPPDNVGLISPWASEVAESRFLARFNTLFGVPECP